MDILFLKTAPAASFRHHLAGNAVSHPSRPKSPTKRLIFLVFSVFETSVTIFPARQCNIPEDFELEQHRCEHLRNVAQDNILGTSNFAMEWVKLLVRVRWSLVHVSPDFDYNDSSVSWLSSVPWAKFVGITSHCTAAASVRVLSSKLFVDNSIINVGNETLTSRDMKRHRRFYIKSLM